MSDNRCWRRIRATRMALWTAAAGSIALAWAAPSLAGFDAIDGISGADYPSDVNVQFNADQGRVEVVAPDGAILNYQDFNLASDDWLHFQHGAGDRVMNRVTGGNMSHIFGKLTGDGHVYLLNPEGIIFGDGAHIDVGGLYAAAADMPDAEFLDGSQDLFTNVRGPVEILQGAQIQANEMVHLIGQQVGNFGQIDVPDGVITMAAGDTVLLYQEHGRVHLRIDDVKLQNLGDLQGATPADFADDPRVEQAGQVNADGGRVMLGAGDYYSLAVRHSGNTNVGSGDVEIAAADGGVDVQGAINAASDEQAGNIQVAASQDIRFHNAQLNATGPEGGNILAQSNHGEIHLGLGGYALRFGDAAHFHAPQLTLTGPLNVLGPAITFDGPLDGYYALSAEHDARFLGPVGSQDPLRHVTIEGDTRVSGPLFATANFQRFQGALQLAGDTSFRGNLMAQGSIDSWGEGHFSLTAEDSLLLMGPVGLGQALDTLTAQQGAVIAGQRVTTLGEQTYMGNVNLTDAGEQPLPDGGDGEFALHQVPDFLEFEGTEVNFQGRLDGNREVYIWADQQIAFGDDVGSQSPLKYLAAGEFNPETGFGPTTIVGGSHVHTTGGQRYAGVLVLEANATLTADGTGDIPADIAFLSDIISAPGSEAGYDLNVNAGRDLFVGANVGMEAPLASLTLAAGNWLWFLDMTGTQSGPQFIHTTGDIALNPDGRSYSPEIATIASPDGSLNFHSTAGSVIMGPNEKLSVFTDPLLGEDPGNLNIHAHDTVTLGDVNTLGNMSVQAGNGIELITRDPAGQIIAWLDDGQQIGWIDDPGVGFVAGGFIDFSHEPQPIGDYTHIDPGFAAVDADNSSVPGYPVFHRSSLHANDFVYVPGGMAAVVEEGGPSPEQGIESWLGPEMTLGALVLDLSPDHNLAEPDPGDNGGTTPGQTNTLTFSQVLDDQTTDPADAPDPQRDMFEPTEDLQAQLSVLGIQIRPIGEQAAQQRLAGHRRIDDVTGATTVGDNGAVLVSAYRLNTRLVQRALTHYQALFRPTSDNGMQLQGAPLIQQALGSAWQDFQNQTGSSDAHAWADFVRQPDHHTAAETYLSGLQRILDDFRNSGLNSYEYARVRQALLEPIVPDGMELTQIVNALEGENVDQPTAPQRAFEPMRSDALIGAR